jgi:3-deoxy-D-manno-octulosonic-acid transferase
MVLAQTNLDQLRLTKLGAKIDGVFGNLKFDVTPNADQVRAGRQLQQQLPKPVVLFASSREGEEAIFLTALQRLSASEREAVQWLVVPRHPQRFDEVAALIESAGLKILRRSSGFLSIPSSPDTVWLGDSVGEMAFYYSLSKVALLGGSFEKLGGQNLIEALACDCPVIMGPHTFNFKEAADLATASGVAFRVPSLQAALNKALQPMLVETNQAGDFVAAHRGAADQTACALISLIAR